MTPLAQNDNFYRTPTKLREGNIFTGVWRSVYGRGGRAIPPHPGTIPPGTITPRTIPAPWDHTPLGPYPLGTIPPWDHPPGTIPPDADIW